MRLTGLTLARGFRLVLIVFVVPGLPGVNVRLAVIIYKTFAHSIKLIVIGGSDARWINIIIIIEQVE
jgi:hypothetical protein